MDTRAISYTQVCFHPLESFYSNCTFHEIIEHAQFVIWMYTDVYLFVHIIKYVK